MNDTNIPDSKPLADGYPVIAINDGDTTWVLVSSAMVMLMIPGLGYFYSGLARHNSALSLIFLSMLSLAVVSFQWFLWGYSLSFAPDGGPFIGNLNYGAYNGLFDSATSTYPQVPTIPGSVFMLFQGMFAAITPALALGASAERTRIIPAIFFVLIWTTLVYDFIAYWTWAPNGWLRVMGVLDYAGGSPVHIASGAAGLALAYVVGKRHGYGEHEFKPHNLSSVFLGTALLWFGWFGFNGGSELAANTRAIVAVVNTNLAACMGGLTWCFLDYYQKRHFSAFAFCSGAVSGLVTVTPAAGLIYPWSAVIFGVLGAVCCEMFGRVKHRFGFDDALDAFGVHGVGGILGNLLTGIFASIKVASLNGSTIAGGWIDGHFMQLLYQLCSCVVTFLWSFVMTCILGYSMNHLPYMNWRLSVDQELMGVDRSQLNASAYDFIEVAVGEHFDARSRKGSVELAEISQSTQQISDVAATTNQPLAVNLEMTQLKS